MSKHPPKNHAEEDDDDDDVHPSSPAAGVGSANGTGVSTNPQDDIELAEVASSDTEAYSERDSDDSEDDELFPKDGGVLTDEQQAAMEEENRKRVALLRKIAKRLQPKVRHGSERNEDWDAILRMKEIHIFVFSMFGLLVSIFASSFKWESRCVEDSNGDCTAISGNSGGTRVTATWDNTDAYLKTTKMVLVICQILMSFSTLVVVLLLVQFYRLQLRDRRMEWSGMTELELIEAAGSEMVRRKRAFSKSYNFFDSSFRYKFLLEVIVHVLHPIMLIEDIAPWLQTVYEILECFVFLRLYLLFRIMYIHSYIYRYRADILKSNRELQRSGYTISAVSVSKVTFYNYPGPVMLMLTVISVAVFGFWIFVIERNGNPQFENLGDCLWFVWVTLSTVGYGDMTPTSVTGKLAVILFVLTSLFLMTIFSGIVTNLLTPTREQKYVQQYLSMKKADQAHRIAAKKLIWAAYQSYRDRSASAYKKGTQSALANDLQMQVPVVYQAIKTFRRTRLRLRQTLGTAADPVVDAKLQKVIIDTSMLGKLLDTQGEHIVVLEQRVQDANEFVRKRLATGGWKRGEQAPPKWPAASARSRN